MTAPKPSDLAGNAMTLRYAKCATPSCCEVVDRTESLHCRGCRYGAIADDLQGMTHEDVERFVRQALNNRPPDTAKKPNPKWWRMLDAGKGNTQ